MVKWVEGSIEKLWRYFYLPRALYLCFIIGGFVTTKLEKWAE